MGHDETSQPSINDKYSEGVTQFPQTVDPETTTPLLVDEKAVGIRATKMRWFALGFGCLCGVGSYYCVDNPQALEEFLHDKDKGMGLSDDQYALLYSVYSMPNVILPFFGGIMIDKIGVRISLALFTFILILGQITVTAGVYFNTFALMIVGRVLFGIGGECLSVSQSSVIAKWFMGKELSFALGASLCVARMGSSLNSVLSSRIYRWSGDKLWMPFAAGIILTVVSFVAALLLGGIDKKADDQEGAQKSDSEKAEKISLKDFKAFKVIYWLLLVNCFFLYGAFFGLNNNLNSMMVKRFGFTGEQAGQYIPIVYVCSAIITPMFGYFTDKFGKRVVFMLIASGLFLLDHLAIAFLNDHAEGDPNYGMIGVLFGIGLFYATYAAIFWPCIPLVVKENMVGSAYGIVTAFQNIMLAIIPLVLAAIKKGTSERSFGYFWTEIFLAGVVACGIAVTFAMYINDRQTGRRLDKPGTDRNAGSKKGSKQASFRSFTRG